MTYHEMKNGHMLLVGGIFPAYKKSRTYRVRIRQEGILENILGRVHITEAGRDRYKVNYRSQENHFNFSARLYKRKPHLLHILDMNGHYTHKDLSLIHI